MIRQIGLHICRLFGTDTKRNKQRNTATELTQTELQLISLATLWYMVRPSGTYIYRLFGTHTKRNKQRLTATVFTQTVLQLIYLATLWYMVRPSGTYIYRLFGTHTKRNKQRLTATVFTYAKLLFTRQNKLVHLFKDILVRIQKAILPAYIDNVIIIESQNGTLMIDVLVHL